MSTEDKSNEADIPVTTPQERRLILTSSAIGTVVEWYDFFLYSFIAPVVFDRLFFPKFGETLGIIAVFATFAVGYLARPLGGLVFGHYGDRLGRKTTMFTTMLLMGVSTVCIGLLPTYATWGAWAALCLVGLRFLQGFAMGGEATAAMLMAIETALHGKRGLFAAIIQGTGPLGIVLATLSVLAISRLPDSDLLSWGWRIPFLASAVLVFIGLYLRFRVSETSAFRAMARRGQMAKVPAIQAFRFHKRQMATGFCVELAHSTFFYLVTIFALSYAVRNAGVSRPVVTQAVLYANMVAMFTIPLFGALSDRVGRRTVMMCGAVCAGLLMTVFFQVLDSREAVPITLIIMLAAGVIHPAIYGPSASFIPELFPTSVRFSGAAIAKQLGSLCGGGLAPLIATAIFAWRSSTVAITIYYCVYVMIALTALILARETKDRQMTAEPASP